MWSRSRLFGSRSIRCFCQGRWKHREEKSILNDPIVLPHIKLYRWYSCLDFSYFAATVNGVWNHLKLFTYCSVYRVLFPLVFGSPLWTCLPISLTSTLFLAIIDVIWIIYSRYLETKLFATLNSTIKMYIVFISIIFTHFTRKCCEVNRLGDARVDTNNNRSFCCIIQTVNGGEEISQAMTSRQRMMASVASTDYF